METRARAVQRGNLQPHTHMLAIDAAINTPTRAPLKHSMHTHKSHINLTHKGLWHQYRVLNMQLGSLTRLKRQLLILWGGVCLKCSNNQYNVCGIVSKCIIAQMCLMRTDFRTAFKSGASSDFDVNTRLGRRVLLLPVTEDTLWPECFGSFPSAALWERSWQSRGSTAHRAGPPALRNCNEPKPHTGWFTNQVHTFH